MPVHAARRAFNSAAFEQLKDASLLAAAGAAAACSKLAVVSTLLTLHPYALAPHALDILDAVPETLPMPELKPLVQQVSLWIPTSQIMPRFL